MLLKTEPNWSICSVQPETDYQSSLVKFPNLVKTYQKLKIGGKSSFALGFVFKTILMSIKPRCEKSKVNDLKQV